MFASIRWSILLLASVYCVPLAVAQEPESGQIEAVQEQSAPEETPTMSLQVLAEQSELVAIVHLRDTRYEYTRSVPTRGWAQLQVLIAYKGSEAGRTIRVYAEGLDSSECYFPDDPDSSGRYLVFLNQRAENGYEGIKPWCQLTVLVGSDHSYALLWPAEGLNPAELADSAQNMDFSDANAWLNPRAFTGVELSELRSRYALQEAEDGRLRYTQGVPASVLRALIFPVED